MEQSTLEHLSGIDDEGRRFFRVAADPDGDLVLCNPTQALGQDLRELDVAERVHLAGLSTDHPALVVEGQRGRYVVLADRPVDLERHVPLGPDDAELLMGSAPRAKFGRRDDDVLTLTPWAEEDEVQVFSPEEPAFADVPLVSVDEAGSLTWHRGGVDDALLPAVQDELERLDPRTGTPVGLLTNVFGEVLCVEEGTALLPHEDIRRQTLMTTSTLLEGARTLAEASSRLRGFAERLESSARAGWRLAHPVVGGIAFAERVPED